MICLAYVPKRHFPAIPGLWGGISEEKTVKAYNRDDMLMVSETKRAMGEKPVIVILETGRPVVLSEIEPKADAILVSFNVQHQALLDIISGKNEPSA